MKGNEEDLSYKPLSGDAEAAGSPPAAPPSKSDEFVFSFRGSRNCVHATCMFLLLVLTLVMLVVMERERRLDAASGLFVPWRAKEAEFEAALYMQV
jgi:hypothetical protein